MTIDASRLTTLLQTLHPGKLSADEAETIVALAQMSVDADGREDAEEIRLFFTLGKAVYTHAGLAETPTPTFADAEDDDAERIQVLAGKLAGTQAREVAYAVAHVLTVADVAIAPAEDRFLTQLRTALAIAPERADELGTLAGVAITPG